MNTRNFAFDAEAFSRTSSLFAAKRRAFAPGAVEMFAAEIVRLLAESGARTPLGGTMLGADRFEVFCDAGQVRHPKPFRRPRQP